MERWLVRKPPREVCGRERARRAAHIASLVHQGDIEGLRKLAVEGGFMSERIRSIVWPVLLNVSPVRSRPPEDRKHREQKQVQLDVVRSLTHVGLSEYERNSRLGELSFLIDSVLAAHPDLHYYQGFNDVCSTLLVVMQSAPAAFPLAERLATHHLKEAMTPSMHPVQQALKFILGILRSEDKQLYQCMLSSDMDPIFCVSWVLTWFAHDLHSLPAIERMYDFFLASHPLMVLYFSASLLRLYRKELLRTRGDYPEMHAVMQHLPNNLPLEGLIRASQRSFTAHPPSSIILAASLQTERAFVAEESMWRKYPYPFLIKPEPAPEPRLIEWKPDPPERRGWMVAIRGGGILATLFFLEQLVAGRALEVLVSRYLLK